MGLILFTGTLACINVHVEVQTVEYNLIPKFLKSQVHMINSFLTLDTISTCSLT